MDEVPVEDEYQGSGADVEEEAEKERCGWERKQRVRSELLQMLDCASWQHVCST